MTTHENQRPITNYGTLLAEIQYFESLGTEYADRQVERLTKLLEGAREKDRKIYEASKREDEEADQEF